MPDRPTLWTLAVPALSVALAFWLCSDFWMADVPPGQDTMAHLVRTDFGLRQVFGRFHLDGWAPTPGVGSEIFLIYGPGLALMTGLLRVLSLGLLSTGAAFRALVTLSFLALPLAVAYLARSFSLSLRAAALAGILALGVSSVYGPGLEGTYGYGLVPHQLAAPVTMVGLGALVRLWLAPRRRLVVPLGACLAVLLVTHPISAVIMAALGTVTVALVVIERVLTGETRWGRRSRTTDEGGMTPGGDRVQVKESLRWGVAAGVVAAALSAFWLVPFLAHRDLTGTLTGWVTPTFGVRLGEVLDGRLLFPPYVALFVVAGMVVLILLAPEQRAPVAMAVAPALYLLVAHEVERRLPFNEIAFQLPNRGLGYAGLMAVLPLAAVLDRLTRSRRRLGDLVAVGAAVAVGVWPVVPLRDAVNTTPRPAAEEAAGELRRRVPSHARFVAERHPEEQEVTGVASPPFWLAFHSRRHTVNAFAPEATTAPGPMYVGDAVTAQDPVMVADRLARYGVTHAVLSSERAISLFRLAGRFSEVWRSGRLVIFAVDPAAGQPQPSTLVSTEGGAEVTLVRASAERLRWRMSAPAAFAANLAVAWSPKWQARLDGRPVVLRRAPDGVLVVDVPAGDHTIEVEFERDGWDRLGGAITAVTLTGGSTLLLVARRRRRRRAAVSPGLVSPRSSPVAR